MAVGPILKGNRGQLRPVEAEDALFTLNIRNDEKLTAFIPRLGGTVEGQTAWIKKQREKEGDYFYIIENTSNEPIGTLSYYDVVGKTCELGRYISYGNAFENVEAAVLPIEHIFSLGFTRIIMNNDERNDRIIRFWTKFGAEFVAKVPMDGWTAAQYALTPDLYSKKKESIHKLIGMKG